MVSPIAVSNLILKINTTEGTISRTFHTYYHTHSPDQSLHSKSDNSWEEEERGDQDVKQRQSCKGLRGTWTSFIDDVMHHKRLQENILNVIIPLFILLLCINNCSYWQIILSLKKQKNTKKKSKLLSSFDKCGKIVLPQERQQWG